MTTAIHPQQEEQEDELKTVFSLLDWDSGEKVEAGIGCVVEYLNDDDTWILATIVGYNPNRAITPIKIQIERRPEKEVWARDFCLRVPRF